MNRFPQDLRVNPKILMDYHITHITHFSPGKNSYTIPAVSFPMSSMASSMSSILNFQSLPAILGLVQYAVSQLSFQGLGSNQINPPVQYLFQSVMQPDEVQQPPPIPGGALRDTSWPQRLNLSHKSF